MEWLCLNTRIDSNDYDKEDGNWSYPDKDMIWIYYRGNTYKYRNNQLTDTVIKLMCQHGLGQVYPPKFPDHDGKSMFVSLNDLLSGVSNPHFIVQKHYPSSYVPASKETYHAALPTFGDF
jgi:hypothetical protein